MKLFNQTLALSALMALTSFCSCGGGINPNPKEGEVVEVDIDDVTFSLVYIAPGSYTMGATPEQEGIDTFTELPIHRVTLSKGFFIGVTEVTQGQWEAVMGTTPSEVKEFNGKQDKELPVTNITWADAKKFVKKLSEKSGMKFRLPTEAEWEYAARGASKSYNRQYSGSQYLDQVACFCQTSQGTPHPVAQFRNNEIGTYDMSGNVSEWVEDNFAVYKDSVQTDPCVVLSDTLNHVARGGSFASKKNQCRTASRESYTSAESYISIGLRVVMEKE